jgi:ribosomal protein S5
MARALTLALAAVAICTVALGGSAASAAPVSGADSSARAESVKFVPGELLVRFRDGVGPDRRLAVRRAEDARFRHTLPVEGIQLVALERGKSALSVAAALERRPEVLYAEPNYYRHVTAVPNDPDFGQLWGLNNTGQLVKSVTGVADSDIDATEAWDITTGSSNVVVGIADTGVAYDHPDLAPQIWSNPGETGEGRETNGKDDDRNGLVDDWRGWDWVDRDNDPSDLNSHGTHVAGTIGARGNDGAGVVGYGLGKAREVPMAIRKGIELAKKNLLKLNLTLPTIPHQVQGRYSASRVLLKPAPEGTGVIAGGPVRPVMEAAGIQNVLTKAIGNTNPHNVVKATLDALFRRMLGAQLCIIDDWGVVSMAREIAE